MTRVLAFIDHSPCATGVVHTAASLAALVGATVDIIWVAEPDHAAPPESPHQARVLHGEPASVMLHELRSSDVVFGVLGSRSVRPKAEVAGHVTLALLEASPVPLVLVPPDGRDLPAERPRFLVPLDGTTDTASALAPIAKLLTAAGAVVVVLHVFSSSSIPSFLGSSHDLDILAEEFLLRHLPEGALSCELRIGHPGPQIIDVAKDQDFDGIAVAWRQDLSPGHAEVLRHLVQETRLPLVVVPIRQPLIST